MMRMQYACLTKENGELSSGGYVMPSDSILCPRYLFGAKRPVGEDERGDLLGNVLREVLPLDLNQKCRREGIQIQAVLRRFAVPCLLTGRHGEVSDASVEQAHLDVFAGG